MPSLSTFDSWDSVVRWGLGAPSLILLTVVVAVLVRWVVHRAIRAVVSNAIARAADRRRGLDRWLAAAAGVDDERRRQRALTMGSLLRSVSTFVIVTIALLTVMALVGLPLGPLLASAGVGGVALGFGAQSLVKDFLSGIFMIMEDQYGVGDVIDTGEAVGTVEEVSLRVTRLRDGNGVVWFIRNGEIVRIGNKSQGWSLATIDIPVAYDEDPARVIPIVREVLTSLYADPAWEALLLEEPTVAGVEAMSGGTMTIRATAKCLPGEQWPVQREVRERAKAALDAAGVRGPQVGPFPGSPGGP